MGRKEDYKETYNEQAYNYCLLGATDAQLAVFLGICEATLNTWKLKHPKFLESIRSAKDEADIQVVKSLFNRARGMTIVEESIRSGGENDVITRTTKDIPPDTRAIEFWLKNRQQGRYRDKQEIVQDITSNITTHEEYDLTNLSDEELVMFKNLATKATNKPIKPKENNE